MAQVDGLGIAEQYLGIMAELLGEELTMVVTGCVVALYVDDKGFVPAIVAAVPVCRDAAVCEVVVDVDGVVDGFEAAVDEPEGVLDVGTAGEFVDGVAAVDGLEVAVAVDAGEISLFGDVVVVAVVIGVDTAGGVIGTDAVGYPAVWVAMVLPCADVDKGSVDVGGRF